MPRQNRVTPFGGIVAVPERGTFLGNRGVLHDADGRVRRPWQVRRWLVCVLEFRGRHRTVMTPGSYTELFFLDEATALAAGHRPCAECRRESFNAFGHAWRKANPADDGSPGPPVAEMDDRLHADRVGPDRTKRRFPALVDELPDGVFVTRPDEEDRAYLLWESHLLEWTPAGYRKRLSRPRGEVVSVLTPRATVEVLRAGYVPALHPTAQRESCGT